MMIMTMYFYQSEKVHFLFERYSVDNSAGYFGVCMVAFFFGFITETLSIVQDQIDQKTSARLKEDRQRLRMSRLYQALICAFRVWFSYFCMLSIMTFNAGIMFCVVAGLAVAYFILGFSPAEVIVLQNTLY